MQGYACAHPCTVPGWSEYLGILGYSDRDVSLLTIGSTQQTNVSSMFFKVYLNICPCFCQEYYQVHAMYEISLFAKSGVCI